MPDDSKITQLRKVGDELAGVTEALKQVEANLPPDLQLVDLPKVSPLLRGQVPPALLRPAPVMIPAHLASYQQVGRYIAAADKAIMAGRMVADSLRTILAAHPDVLNADQAKAALELWDKRIG